MKRLMVLGLALAGLLLVSGRADAFGHRHGCRGAAACGSGWGGMSACASGVVYAVSCGAPAHVAATPAYEERTVTMYRAEVKTRTVERTVHRVVTKEVEEPYTYTEMVAVTTPEKRTETVYTTVTKEVPYTYTVSVPVMSQEKRTITEYVCVAKQVPYTYTVSIPVMAQEKRTQTVYTCVPEQVTVQVPVCRLVATQVVNPCTGCCHTVCCRVTEMQTVTRTVMRSVPHTREVMVNVCHYKTEERKGTRTVHEMVPRTREAMVHVCNYKTEERKGTRTVCDVVPQKREYTVNVVTCKPVERKATRKRFVCETVTEKVPVKEHYTEMVPYTTTVRVPVGGHVYADCGPAPCGKRHGLLGRLFSCCR